MKINNGKWGTINFNNMLPVTRNNIIEIDLNVKVKDENQRKYVSLLRDQLRWLRRNSDDLYRKSYKLYNEYVNGTLNKGIMKRCCNFKLLEEKCKEYNEKNN